MNYTDKQIDKKYPKKKKNYIVLISAEFRIFYAFRKELYWRAN